MKFWLHVVVWHLLMCGLQTEQANSHDSLLLVVDTPHTQNSLNSKQHCIKERTAHDAFTQSTAMHLACHGMATYHNLIPQADAWTLLPCQAACTAPCTPNEMKRANELHIS